MKKLILVLCIVFLPVFACAETTFTLSPKAVYYAYHEQVMDETGYLKGLNAEVEHFFSDGLALGLEAEVLAGELRYDGQYSDGTKLSCTTDDVLVQTTASVGKRFTVSSWDIQPYAGLKYRYWQNDIIVAGGYLRRIHQFYLPVGLVLERELSDGWSMKLKPEASLLLYGEVLSDLSDVSSQYSDAENAQRFADGVGARLAASFTKDMGSYGLGFTPYFEWYEVNRSEKDTIRFGGRQGRVVEPHNTTWMLGLSLNVSF